MNTIKFELAILLLWLVAIVPTLLILRQSGLITYLSPLYFMCIVGSIYVVRSAKRN